MCPQSSGLVCWCSSWCHSHMAARTGASMWLRLRKDFGCKQLYVGWINHMVLLYSTEWLSDWALRALHSSRNYRQALYRTRNYIYIYTLLCIFHYVLSQDTHTHTRLVTKSYPTLCDPLDCSPPGSSVHGIFQARVLEWVAISFCRVSSRSSPALQVNSLLLSHQNNKPETLLKQKKERIW